MIPTCRIGGFDVSRLDLRATVDELASWLDADPGPARYFVCGNPYSFETARQDAEFSSAIRAGSLVCADGVGVVIASRLLGGAVAERVCGPDVFLTLCSLLDRDRPGTRMFFLGSDEANLAAMAERFERDFPRLVLAGTMAPPFRQSFTPEDDEAMVGAINNSRAEVLWIGLGAPKQEKWAFRNRHRLGARILGPVGALFDFYSGRFKQPPHWMRAVGGYSLFRVLQEPVRVGRRLARDARFMVRVGGDCLRGQP